MSSPHNHHHKLFSQNKSEVSKYNKQKDLKQSQYFSEYQQSYENVPIPNKILQKYLTQDQHPIFNLIEVNFDKFVKFLKPFYAITTQRILKNVTGLITSKWEFQLPEEEIQKNIQQKKEFIRMSHYLVPNNPVSARSIQSRNSMSSSRMRESMKVSSMDQRDLYKLKYNRSMFMFIWGPISLIILTHLISNHPFSTEDHPDQTLVSQNSNINVIAGGIIDLLLMTLLSFGMFVFFKVFKTQVVHSLFQHMCLSSYVGILTIFFSLICSSAPVFLIIPSAIAYILGSSYLHINAYNQSTKPQLFELIGLGLIILFFYGAAGFMFYRYYHMKQQVIVTEQKHFFAYNFHQRHYNY